MSRVVGILLAAGQSSRFGSNKCMALLPDKTPMGLQSARNLASHVEALVVVIPPENPALAAMFVGEGFKTVICPTAALGMSESLKSGICYFDDTKPHAYLIALADMPVIKPETYRVTVAALKQGADISSPQCQNKRGHPVGFNAKYRNELLALKGDQGAKVLFQKYHKTLTLLAVDDPGIHQDFDTRILFEQCFNDPTS
ncbi:MAG: nucleotidyltransferase family protein [Leucothrix sp.]